MARIVTSIIFATNKENNNKYHKENYQNYSLKEIKQKAGELYHDYDGVELEYFRICDVNTLNDKEENENKKSIALVACFVDGIRLIDNMMLF